jgi:hypothetical protein
MTAGGLPVEGTLYGESIGSLIESLVALKTAGYADPTISGPSVNMLTSSYWDDYVTGLLHSIAPAPYIPSQASGWAFQGQTWPIATYGDTLVRGSSRTRSTDWRCSAWSIGRATTRRGSIPSVGLPRM